MAHDESESVIGKIQSVWCKDFITYEEVTLFPGDYLNIILGPNGTGKSSIVAAMLIGMGGSCKLMARSADLSDFIKNGKTKAEIKITIYKDKARSVRTFYRSFSSNKDQTWRVDNKSVNQKEYLSYVAQFNIQIDNLCQFLPQDRVQDFAKMNAHEILLNTQKSVCSIEMMEMFKQLIALKDQWNNSEIELAENRKRLIEISRRNDDIRAKLEKLKEINDLTAEINICNSKKAWIEFEALYLQCKALEKDLALGKKALADHESVLATNESHRTEYINKKKYFEEKIAMHNSMIVKLKLDVSNFESQFEKLEDEINRTAAHLRGIVLSAQDQGKEITENEKLLSVYIFDLEKAETEVGNLDEINLKITNDKRQANELNQLESQTIEKRNTLGMKLDREIQPELSAVRNRIEQLENIGEVRMKLVRQKYQDTYNGIMWLRQNKHKFNHTIYEPAIIEVNVKDPKNAIYIENTVSYRDLISFICEDTNDSIKLMNSLRNENNWRTTNVATNSDKTVFQPKIPLNNIRQFGFYAYLIDFIEGPPVILNQLCRLYNLHNIPVGNDYTYENSDKVPHDFRLYFTTRHRISVTFSQYTGLPSTSEIEINPHNLMNVSIDRRQLESEKQKIIQITRKSDQMRNLRNDMENKCAEYRRKLEDVRNVIKESERKLAVISQCRDKIKRQEQKIYELKHTTINVEEEKRKSKANSKRIISKMIKQETDKIKVIEALAMHIHELEKHKIKSSIFMRGKEDIEQQVHTCRERVREARRLCDIIQNDLDRKKIVTREKQNEAKVLTEGKTPSDRKSFPFREAYNLLPNTIEEIEAHLDDIQARLECLPQHEQVNMQLFEEQLETARRLEERINNFGSDKSKLDAEILTIHQQWFPEISRIIDLINVNFARFMESMGYAGEIELKHSDDEHDYKSYGVEIRVKYRQQEKIQTLDRFVQSGGERAVAIAIYSLSIQHISQVPFRCVDEINQGMDARNERKFFEMLVEETCMDGNSQYFFISPKLLPNLSYNDLMTVHVVMNGVGVASPDLFSQEM